jgi:hypothetical protein
VANIPLGGSGANFDSKKSRGMIINMIAEADQNQNYSTVKRCDGLTNFATALGAARSNILVNGDHAYFISGTHAYRVTEGGLSQDLGIINGSGFGQVLSNSVPNNNQILFLNGSGLGYIYNNAGLVQITDADFFQTTSGTVLNERFWFIRDGTNEFFASDVSDGFSYNPLSFASAEESPDFGKAIIAKKSSLWVIGNKTMEFWQSFDDVVLPIRKVRGSTIERGIQARASLAEAGEYFAFLADDLTVRLISGNSNQIISDLSFNLKVRGNGTATSRGFTTTEDAIGFFVDTPTHKIYYISFPSEGYTWGYDLTTGLTHVRESGDFGFWRANSAAIFNGKIIVGDNLSSAIWLLDPDAKTEGSEILRATLRTTGISFDYDITIPLIEVDIEVGQIEDPSISPSLMVRYTKDGGYNWINHSDISLGNQGNYRKRVVMRNFGRLVRHKDFALELIVTDPVRMQIYSIDLPMSDML